MTRSINLPGNLRRSLERARSRRSRGCWPTGQSHPRQPHDRTDLVYWLNSVEGTRAISSLASSTSKPNCDAGVFLQSSLRSYFLNGPAFECADRRSGHRQQTTPIVEDYVAVADAVDSESQAARMYYLTVVAHPRITTPINRSTTISRMWALD